MGLSVTRSVTFGDEHTAPAAWVAMRLEEAGATLMAMRHTGFSPRLRVFWPEMVRDSFIDLPSADLARVSLPGPERISAMDEAFAWVGLIPPDRTLLRRLLLLRALVNPVTERHVYSWRRLARHLGADHRAVGRWHGDALDMVVVALRRRKFIFPP